MTKFKTFAFAACLILLSTYPLVAQSYPSSTPRIGSSTTPNSQHRRQQPCWQQVGVPQSAEQQRRQIEQSTRAEVEAVCSDSSLSQQQKQEKIRQLHAQARKQVEGLLSPQQEQAMKSCREQRNAGRSGGGMHGGGGRGGSGPCGEMTSGGGLPGGTPRGPGAGRTGTSPQSEPPIENDEPDQL
jgi:Spy/CpxP family protein refolding chaperone